MKNMRQGHEDGLGIFAQNSYFGFAMQGYNLRMFVRLPNSKGKKYAKPRLRNGSANIEQ
jgi:hypothetical protein